MTPRRSLVTILVFVATAGCAGLVGSKTGGLLEVNVLPSDSSGVEPVPLSEVDDDRLRRVTEEAISAYESNGTAETAAAPVPEPKLDETREAHERLTDRPDGKDGRLVTYRGYTVRIRMLIYT